MQMTGTAPELGLARREIKTLQYAGLLETHGKKWNRHYTLTIPEPRNIGDAIRIYRIERRLTKKRLAELAGINENTASNYEHELTAVKPLILYFILRAMNVRIYDFFARIEGRADIKHYRVGSMDFEAAVMDTLTTFELKKPNSNSFPTLDTLLRLCREGNVDWLTFWQYVDARLPQ